MSGNKTIGVLGCGWLGAPLAEKLIADGYTVKGTVRSNEKKQTLKNSIPELFVVHVTEKGVTGDTCFFDDLDVLVIAIPPGLRKAKPENFVQKMSHVMAEVINNNVKHVMYVSTTAVFPNDNRTYDESSIPIPFDAKSEQLIAVEKLFLDSDISSSIIRMGGLVNKSRHPITMLAKRGVIKNPDAPVNLIHQKDAIGIITSIIYDDCWGFVFHGVAPLEVSKRAYYAAESQRRGLTLCFDEANDTKGKRVTSKNTILRLKYIYQNPDCQ